MTIIKKYNLDKENAKQDLIEHFSSLDRYKEWDFSQDGSALNLMMEVLAYNSAQNAFVANRLASELLLETSQKRSIAVSNANTLGGYMPKTAQASRTNIKITINSFGDSAIPEYVFIPKGQKFFAENGYEFFTIENHVLYPDTNGFGTLDDIEIFEGRRISYIATGADNGFVISNKNFDLSTLNISVDGVNAVHVGTEIDVSSVKPDTICYFMKENFEGRYEVSFGDGFFGVQINHTNEIEVDYIVSTSLDEANGINVFSTDPIQGYSDITIIAQDRTHSGSIRETIESIKLNAPLHFSAANRAVNHNDFKYLIEKNFSFVKSTAVWGGEKSKNFGNVFISCINQNDENISVSQKQQIIEFLQNYTVGSISTILQDSKAVDIYPIINVTLDPKQLAYSTKNVKAIIQQSIDEYAESISGFSVEYSATNLSNYIEKNLSGIRHIKIENRINQYVELGTTVETELNFDMAIYHPFDGYGKEADGVLISTEIKDPNTNISYFVNDDGYGNLRLYFNNDDGQKVYVSGKQGTVNYTTGEIKINPFNAMGSTSYTMRSTPAKDIIVAEGNTILKLTSNNAILVIETNV